MKYLFAQEISEDFWLDQAEYEPMPDTSLSKSVVVEPENGKVKKKVKSKDKTKVFIVYTTIKIKPAI